ncbi:MAG: hypothetical protein IAF38_21840 [Bacteroidia bacterium]|nr:hypothetical protein [Bacteroidia bacterium]
MKMFYSSFVFLISLSLFYGQQSFVLKGNFLGDNIYIQNPYAASGKGFCTQKVLVNGIEYPSDSIQSSAYEIDLRRMNFKAGDSVQIEIFHGDNCKPKLINTQSHYPPRPKDVLNLRIENDSLLKWETERERINHTFAIQQYRWNKWVKIEETETEGVVRNWEEAKNIPKTKDIISYSINIKKYFHSGKNQFRISSYSLNKPNISKPISIEQPEREKIKPGINYNPLPIEFPTETLYEVYDHYGNIVKRGFAKSVYLNKLPSGEYYLNYDNETITVIWH